MRDRLLWSDVASEAKIDIDLEWKWEEEQGVWIWHAQSKS